MTTPPMDCPGIELPAEDCEPAVRRVAGRPVTPAEGSPPAGWLKIPVEAPVNIAYGKAPVSVPYAVVMASPVDLLDLVTGFSLTEGIVERVADLRAVEITPTDKGILATADIAGKALSRHLARRRTFASRTGCGVCGIEDLAELPAARPPAGPRPVFEPDRLAAMLATLKARQVLHARTHAVHAAAWFDAAGRLVALREDVGRHNALDKLIGALARAAVSPAGGAVVITSRCSFEMVEKAAVFGARLVIAVSAPTSLAVNRAQALGVTLLAAARGTSALQFTPLPTPSAQDPVP